MKNKTTAGILALLLGGLGAHKFYLGRILQGLLYLIFCWTFIPAVISLIEGIWYLTMSDADFNLRFNAGLMMFAAQQPQNIVVNVANHANSPVAAPAATVDLTDRIRSLLDLKNAGALTEEEFQSQKQRLLAAD
jgi:TM2 domain-containing membrane protein YozV